MNQIQTAAGQRRVIVMIPGWGMNSSVWQQLAERLAINHHCICLDLPGHGGSQVLGVFSLTAVAETLLNVILEPVFTLVGWSLGASVAIEMARLSPDRVHSLMLVAGTPKFVKTADWPGVPAQVFDEFAVQLAADLPQTMLRFLALQVYGSANARQVLQQLKTALSATALPRLDTLIGGLNILKYSDVRPVLRQLNCPIRAIYGGNDQLIPVASASALRDINPAICVHIIDTAGHALFLSHQQEFYDWLLAGL